VLRIPQLQLKPNVKRFFQKNGKDMRNLRAILSQRLRNLFVTIL